MKLNKFLLPIVAGIGFLIFLSLFVVKETNQAIVLQFGDPKKVTQERMYLETMEKVLADINKVIIDKKSGGVVPYLPLPELSKKVTN